MKNSNPRGPLDNSQSPARFQAESKLSSDRLPADFPVTIPLTVTRKELGLIPDYSKLSIYTLRRRYRAIADYVGKQPSQPVTLIDVAEYLGVSPWWVARCMRRTR